MIIVLHGDNQIASRNELTSIKESSTKNGDEVVVLNGQKTELSAVKQALESGSLFGGGRLLVIEGLLTGKASKAQKEIADYLKKVSEKAIVWEGKKVSPTAVKSVNGTEKEFKFSPEIFRLTDSIRSDNTREMLESYSLCLTQDDVEMVFYMMCRQVRMMIQAKTDQNSISGNPYMLRKLSVQVKNFSQEKLLSLHNKLYLIDKSIKNGSNPLPLTDQLEQWLLEI